MSNNEFGFSKFSDNDFYSNVNKELIDSLDIKSDLNIVDLGCGSGGNLWMLANEGFRTYGLDISSKSIQITKKILGKILKKNTVIES